MNRLYRFALLVLWLSLARGDALKPETAAAFDHYVKLTEEGFAKRTVSDFLWLDHNRKQKDIIWLGQTVLEPNQTLDGGKEIEIPGGLLQDWIGTLFLDGQTLDHVRDMILNFADYKTYFKAKILDSKLVKHDGDNFDMTVRFYKRQVTPIVLNAKFAVVATAVDAKHAYIAGRATRIGEAAHPNKKSTYEQERADEDAIGYLWRLNFYWHLEEIDDGVYAELELISLSKPGGGLHPGRLLSGFETLPREIAETFLDGLRQAFPLRH